MLASGLSPQQIMSSLQQQVESATQQQAFAKVEQGLAQGQSWIDLLLKYRCLSRYHYQVLSIAEGAGKLVPTFLMLAHQLEQRQERQQRLKVQIGVAQAIISIALLVQIVVAVIGGLFPLSAIIFWLLMLFLTRSLYFLLAQDIFVLLSMGVSKPLLKTNQIVQRVFEYYFYDLLLMQLSAGIDAQQAIRVLSQIFPSASLRHKLRAAQHFLEQGNSLTSTLIKANLVFTTHLKQVLSVGEQSGRLEQNLAYHLRLEAQYLDIIIRDIFAWLPRVYYTIALILLFKWVMY